MAVTFTVVSCLGALFSATTLLNAWREPSETDKIAAFVGLWTFTVAAAVVLGLK
jgi:hypothetical protein